MVAYNLLMIEELTGDDTEFMRIMIETFIEEVPGDIFAMNEAIENENAALTFQIAHKMKPNLQLFGLDLLPEVEKLEAWNDHSLNIEDILIPAKKISNTVLRATEELKKDFNL